MDSISQIVLGAAVGEAVCGKKIGNKAMAWGALAGTIPDLDVLANPFLDTVGELSFHRSISHSVLFAVVAAPLLAWIMRRLFPHSKVAAYEWFLLYFLGFITHIFLDTFTTWGTQLLWPFSDYGYALYAVFVIDPLYTLPFLAFLLAAMTRPKTSNMRRWLNAFGLIISTGYLFLSLLNQHMAEKAFLASMQRQQIPLKSYICKPTAFNTLLWGITAETDDGFYSGYYSLFDAPEEINFSFIPKYHQLLGPFRGDAKLERLLEITKGYYTVEKSGDLLLINDLRFGDFNGWQDGQTPRFVFIYQLSAESERLTIAQIPFDFRPDANYLKQFWARITGARS